MSERERIQRLNHRMDGFWRSTSDQRWEHIACCPWTANNNVNLGPGGSTNWYVGNARSSRTRMISAYITEPQCKSLCSIIMTTIAVR